METNGAQQEKAETARLTRLLLEDPNLRWVASYVRHYGPVTHSPQYWPGITEARRVALDRAIESGLVECHQFPAVNPYYSTFSVGQLGRRAIAAAVKAGAR